MGEVEPFLETEVASAAGIVLGAGGRVDTETVRVRGVTTGLIVAHRYLEAHLE